MRKLTYSTWIAVVLSLLAVMPAMAATITVNFDDLVMTRPWPPVALAYTVVPASYVGLNWVGWEAMNRASYNTVYGLSEGALPSDPNFAYGGNEKPTLTMSSGTPFYFLGTELSKWNGNLGAPGAANSVTITGWLGATNVGSVTSTLSSGWANSGGIAGAVDRLEFSPTVGYFRMDDLTIEPVPEPATLFLGSAGLVAFSLLKWRRKTATATSS